MNFNKSRIKHLEEKITKNKLKLLLESGDYLYLDKDDIISLLVESYDFAGIRYKCGNVEYQDNEMSDELARLEEVVRGQDDLIDKIKATIQNYKRGVRKNEEKISGNSK